MNKYLSCRINPGLICVNRNTLSKIKTCTKLSHKLVTYSVLIIVQVINRTIIIILTSQTIRTNNKIIKTSNKYRLIINNYSTKTSKV